MKTLAAVITHREILLNLVRKNLKGKYAGSVLGMLWVFITPLLLALIVSFIFTKVMKMNIPNTYLFILAGWLPWNFFAGSLSEVVASIPGNANMLRQFSMPRILIPLSVVLANFTLLLAGFLITLPFFVFVNPKTILMLPLLIIGLFLHLFFTSGLSAIVSALYVSFRDLGQLLNTILMFWLWLTPVFYSPEMLPPEYAAILLFNPMIPYIGLYRDALIYNGNIHFILLGIALVLALAVAWLGMIIFNKYEKDFLKRI